MKKITTIIRDRQLIREYISLMNKNISKGKRMRSICAKYQLKGQTVKDILANNNAYFAEYYREVKKCPVKLKK